MWRRRVTRGRRCRWRMTRRLGGWRHEANQIVEVIKPFNLAGIRIQERVEVWGGLTQRLSRGGSFNGFQYGDAINFKGRNRVGSYPSSGRILGHPSFGFSPKIRHGVGSRQLGMESKEKVQ
jgi:hypothetical protein